MKNFASLWIGNKLTKIEEMCIKSFIDFGHSFVLFVYDLNMDVPDGVIKKDANLILKENEIFKINNSYGPFADIFRYKMIKETEMIWVDTDLICLKEEWNFGEYIYGYEKKDFIAIGVLSMPSNSQLCNILNMESNRFKKDSIVWSEIGPDLITKSCRSLNIMSLAQEVEVFYPIYYPHWKIFWDPQKTEEVLNKIKNSHSVHLWNQFLNINKINKDHLPKNSFLDIVYRDSSVLHNI